MPIDVVPAASSSAPATHLNGVPTDHWDLLFSAVMATLRESATGSRSHRGMTEWPSRDTTILECVRQLELLRDALHDERSLADRSLCTTSMLLEALLDAPPAVPHAPDPAEVSQSVRPPPAPSSAQSSSCTSTR